MKILKYIIYRMQGYTKLESYKIMAINDECSYLEYELMYNKYMKNKYKEGETNVSNKRNSRHKKKTDRT